MSEEPTQPLVDPSSVTRAAAQILTALGNGNGNGATTDGSATVESFLRCTRDQLLVFAKRLGVAGVSKLSKSDLATRLHGVFAALGPLVDGAAKQGNGSASNGSDGTGFPSKYDLGPDAGEPEMPRHIPWGYGQDRVTAMVVDPDRLFVYWEVTDDAISRGQRELGRGGASAWLNVRVYDVTGRLFDGTNAHSYFDHKLERHDRQWFFDINKPTSAACVEVGLRSSEGFFVKLARSGRVEFPRREPIGGGHVEWLTVQTAQGGFASPQPGTLAGPPAAPALAPQWEDGSVQAADAGSDAEDSHPVQLISQGEVQHEHRWEWREGVQGQWQQEVAGISWTEPVIRSTWESGPFTYPVESPVFTQDHQPSSGPLTYRTEAGRVHITYGPWQVVIRGLGARAERRVLSTWQITHRWSTVIASETTPVQWKQLTPGSSEWVALGGSERAWIAGSELRLSGASEVFFLGASETRLLGASERLLRGASEYRFRGASERLQAGASEYRLLGASERLLGGASELRLGGASELPAAGGSERVLAYPLPPAAKATGTDGGNGGRG